MFELRKNTNVQRARMNDAKSKRDHSQTKGDKLYMVLVIFKYRRAYL